MKILHLHLKKQWYEMIERGEKTEEYRYITHYWTVRLFKYNHGMPLQKQMVVRFYYGYTSRTMDYIINSIEDGIGKPQWGAPNEKKVYIIKLGNRIQ